MSKLATRDRIVEAADDLFYQHGFEHTSLSDIAKIVNISQGNFYHHFKTKDDILHSVIDLRLARTQTMLEQWEKLSPSPTERIKCYVKIVITNWNKIKQHGCPVGTLTTELTKIDHLSQADARKIFRLFRNWLTAQFTSIGQGKNADDCAMRVLSWSQGVATLGNAFKDKKFVDREVSEMCLWVDDLAKNSDC